MNKYGILFPFQSDGRGSVQYSNTLVQSIEDSIKQIILTKKGERVHNVEFGCDLWKITFSLDQYIVNELVNDYITEALTRYEPRIDLNEITCKRHDNYIDIKIIYLINNSNLPMQEVNIQFYE